MLCYLCWWCSAAYLRVSGTRWDLPQLWPRPQEKPQHQPLSSPGPTFTAFTACNALTAPSHALPYPSVNWIALDFYLFKLSTFVHLTVLPWTKLIWSLSILYCGTALPLNLPFTSLCYTFLNALYISLHCPALPWLALHCTILHCTSLHCTALHCTALHCTALNCAALHFTRLNCTALHPNALHCTMHLSSLHFFTHQICSTKAGTEEKAEETHLARRCFPPR